MNQRMWIFVSPALIPPKWRERAREAWLIPLLQEEEMLILGSSIEPTLSQQDQMLAKLLAGAVSPDKAARALGVTTRSFYRRVAMLRQRFEVDSTPELISVLADRGFTWMSEE